MVIRRLREEIRNAERDLEAANARIEDLTIKDQDATGSIEALRVKNQESQDRIQEMEEENDQLESKRVQAEVAYDMQVSLAASAAARRRDLAIRVKRERDGSRDLKPGTLGRDPKGPRNIITTVEDGPVNLSSDENVGNLASSTLGA
jgi:chromosome segregation ATPase